MVQWRPQSWTLSTSGANGTKITSAVPQSCTREQWEAWSKLEISDVKIASAHSLRNCAEGFGEAACDQQPSMRSKAIYRFIARTFQLPKVRQAGCACRGRAESRGRTSVLNLARSYVTTSRRDAATETSAPGRPIFKRFVLCRPRHGWQIWVTRVIFGPFAGCLLNL
jgi:hypothetical protein